MTPVNLHIMPITAPGVGGLLKVGETFIARSHIFKFRKRKLELKGLLKKLQGRRDRKREKGELCVCACWVCGDV